MKKSIALLILCSLFQVNSAMSQSTQGNSRVNVHVDGSKRLTRLDGIGVNANTRSWNGKELEPALNLLLDSMHASLWRVVVETVEKWEEVNDNNDPFTFNWDYYDKLYETPKFQKAWEMILYLNQRGITNNLMINFMGPVPAWMGKKTIKPEFEDEYVEMIASFFYYGKHKRHIQFGLISPTNESDWRNEGPEIDEFHYATVLRKLIDRMAALGMGDVRYVGPDPASMKAGISRYVPEMMKDPVIMSKVAHIGLHSYGGYYANADSAMKSSPYPKSTFWITEWNAWRDGLDDGKIGVYDYKFAAQCVDHLLDLLGHGATGAMEWEAYDSYYEHHAPSLFSYWGILGYNPSNKTYSPRKHFYAIQQVSKFVYPGSFQIALSEDIDSVRVLAFEDPSTNSLTLVGINMSGKPVTLSGDLANLPAVKGFEMTYTNNMVNLRKAADVPVNSQTFQVTVLPNSIFTLKGIEIKNQRGSITRPEPENWYAGDIHVHRNCGDGTTTVSIEKLAAMMEPNDLAVISVLADMGNGEVKDSQRDLPRVNGSPSTLSTSSRIVEWDAEWHWDATYSNFSNQALGGHLVLLGLKEAHQIWDESPYKVLEWARKQNAISGFCHFQYLNDSVQNDLNCCIPIEFPVEAALGSIDFIAEDVFGSDSPNNGTFNSEAAMNAYYRLLNCGFRLGLAAGTDYPCNNYEALGTLLTYVKANGNLTYRKWIEGIKKGNTVVARNGHREFIDMKVNEKYGPGDVIAMTKKGQITVEVKWTTTMESAGRIELVSNGKVIASQAGTAKPGEAVILTFQKEFTKSSWVCARRMDGHGHQSHTAPVYIAVNAKPVRANAADAQFFVVWIDNLLEKTSPRGKWNRYFTHDLNVVQDRYRKARDIYKKIVAESQTGGSQL